jgi:tetratricopeptide (TPR) repeat protein
VGTRLSVVTVFGIGLLCASAQAQTPPTANAAEQYTKGQELYRAGDFGNALPLFEEAHRAEPANFDYQWSLAQTLRQTGSCDKALLHYQALREAAPDPKTARDVRDQMALCPGGAVDEEEAAPPPPPPPPPDEHRMRGGGSGGGSARSASLMTLSFGVAVALGLGGFQIDKAADSAARHDDRVHLENRAKLMYIGAGAFAAVGVSMAVITIRRSGGRKAEVALAPRAGGAALVVGGSW